jgi:stage V sporulation protein G
MSATENYDDTTAVTAVLLSLKPMRSGRILALADVEITVEGVSFTLYGVQVTRTLMNGQHATRVDLPQSRGPDGVWKPAVSLPPEMKKPLGDVVLEACLEAGICKLAEEIGDDVSRPRR